MPRAQSAARSTDFCGLLIRVDIGHIHERGYGRSRSCGYLRGLQPVIAAAVGMAVVVAVLKAFASSPIGHARVDPNDLVGARSPSRKPCISRDQRGVDLIAQIDSLIGASLDRQSSFARRSTGSAQTSSGGTKIPHPRFDTEGEKSFSQCRCSLSWYGCPKTMPLAFWRSEPN
jgi:hypothetical protein